MLDTLRALRFVARHPLNRRAPVRAIARVMAWQLATRLRSDTAVVPFVGGTRLLVRRGMTGATGNVYCGLHEFEDMGFVLHALRPDDLFVDIGANVGSYTVLAAGAVGARCIAFEPASPAHRALLDNLRLNDLTERVEVRKQALAAVAGEAEFTAGLDTVNHVVASDERPAGIERVPITTLDAALAERTAALIKMDVEGYETSVVLGADRTLRSPSLRAVLMELNGSGARYGFDERSLHQRMLAYHFTPAEYDPLRRSLRAREWREGSAGNVLYVRDPAEMSRHLAAARAYEVHGTTV